MENPAFNVGDLSKLDNPARREFVSLLCTAAFSEGGSEAAVALIEGCLKLCGGSRSLLSNALQTPFLTGRTLLHSALCSIDRPTKPREIIPPVIGALLDQCTQPLSDAIKGDIEIACCERDDNALLHTLRHHPSLRPWTPDESGHPTITISEDHAIVFTIPRFLDQILVNSKVEFPFVIMG